MTVVPNDLDTDSGPPTRVPLQHFLVALGCLCLAVGLGVLTAFGQGAAGLTLAHVHLLLAGWVCITIMGAMTQFVPVWSGATLHSRRLARWQLWTVAAGLLGVAGAFALGQFRLVAVFGTVLLAGFWLFAYNIGRTLWGLPEYDITERHFALALGFLVVATTLGLILALDFRVGLLGSVSVPRTAVVTAHATLAVFGVVITTVLGALYQLATMFTQTELHGIDRPLRRLEAVGYPVGVLALAGGRLLESAPLATAGGLLVAASLGGFSVILARRLVETQVPWTPMCSRYAVAAVALAGWAVLAVPAWFADPLAGATVFGAPRTLYLLVVGVVGFVVLGTLYHIVPFIVWVERYSDRLGYEPVPMIDDLYDDRLAALDFGLLVVGTAGLVAADWLGWPTAAAAAGVVLLAGVAVFLANILGVIRTHSHDSLATILGVAVGGESASATTEAGETAEVDSG
ncbi:hypothetical protein EGH24_02275 [Halonotius terrestris]|uniref:Cbb3-type cytochrome c oxidase subunit I n=1 Tax=Halonotius terrestris TaxID=2487750 RepID=A0A8J8PBP7_9EURY|nr:cbb3-type cytochrome c oxidase subunit I [Halonotius terrestris]TQQ83639.1 hypothetical protein EGH24_02275 [Halonotius terrestris]